MPPQFFKDAHNGLANKFVPRGFAFNIASMAPTQGASTNTESAGSGDTSENSDTLPQASSTAPSTSGSSHFFLKTKEDGGKPGSKSKALSAPAVTIHTGGKPHGIPDNMDNAPEGLSVNSLETSATEISQSISQRAVSTAGAEEEDDLQITDIREISNAIQEIPVEVDETGDANETSSDLLLEALFKSQKLCSVLKEKLELANAKIHNQSDDIDNQKKSMEKVKETYKSFKSHLLELETSSVQLRESRAADNKTILELKSEYHNTTQRLQEYKQQVANFQQKVEYLKQIKVASNYEVEKRNKEIKTLKIQLDDTQGLLSEQKIRTVQLEKIVEASRKEYDARVAEMIAKSDTLEKTLSSKIDESVKLVDASFGELPDFIHIKNDLKDDISKRIDSLSEQLITSLKLTEDKVSRDLNTSTETITGALRSGMDEVKNDIQIESTSLTNNHKSVTEGLNKLYETLSSISEESRTENTVTTALCKEVIEALTKLDKDIKDQNNTIATVDEWKAKNGLLQLQCDKLNTSLSITENEHAKLQEELRVFTGDLRSLELAKTDAIEEMKKIQAQLESNNAALKTSEDKAAKCKTSCESKLRTQSELYKMVSEEREKTRKDLDEARAKLLELQNELTVKHNADLQQKQNHNANIRAINEKEKVLMILESENATLKKKIDDLQVELKNNKASTSSNVVSETIPPLESAIQPKSKRSTPASKKAPSTLQVKSSQKQLSQAKKVTKPLHKRKMLLDDDEEKLIFDDFDLDALNDEPPVIPKRYTKRKKTMQY